MWSSKSVGYLFISYEYVLQFCFCILETKTTTGFGNLTQRIQQPPLLVQRTLSDPLFESHFTGDLGRQWRTSEKTIDTPVSEQN